MDCTHLDEARPVLPGETEEPMSEQKPTPGPWQREGVTIFQLNEAGTNRWSALVQGRVSEISAKELYEIAEMMRSAPETAAELVEANGYAERLLKSIWPEHEYPRFKVCTDMLGKLTQLDHALGSRRVKLEETAAELARKVELLNRIRDWMLSCGVLPESDEEVPSVLRGMLQAAGTNAAELRRLQDLFRSLFEPGFGGGDELEVTFDSEANCWNGLWCGVRSAGNTCEEAAIATVSAVMMRRAAEMARAMKERDRLGERNKELLEALEAAQRALSNDPLGLSDFGDGRFTIEAIDAAIARAKEGA
jgi:hypothetical protein